MDEALWQDLLRRIDEADPVALAAELVRIPSHPGIDRQEEAVVAALEGWLCERGVPVLLDRVAPGRPNLIARVGAEAPGRRLLLCGHTDTVPLNADDPGVGFSALISDGRLYGRGAVDMKGAVAAMAVALYALADRLPAGELVLAAVVDEEMESIGAERLVNVGFGADGAIVGEPTGNRLALGHKGLEWLEVEFLGRAAHGGTPEQGINAVVAAARFVAAVEERLKPRFAERRHPLLGPPTLNFGTVRGGDQPSTVAARCLLALDRRTVPGESCDSALAELSELLGEIARSMPGLETRIGRVAGGMATLEHGPLSTDPESPIALIVAAALAAERGAPSEPTVFPAWTDAALLSNFAQIPTVVLGPGELALAHSPRESVPIAEIVEAARIYTRAAFDFCTGPESTT